MDRSSSNGTQSMGDAKTMQGAFREIRIGMNIGPDNRYLIKDILGKGGMGEVYLAIDEISKTEVAIKLVPREVSTSEDEMEQVRKNFALVRNLHHPNIAAVTALEQAAQQARAEAERIQKEMEASEQARLAAEALARQQRSEAERLAKEAESRRVREAQEAAQQRAAEEERQRQLALARRIRVSASFESFPDGDPQLNGIELEEAKGVDKNP